MTARNRIIEWVAPHGAKSVLASLLGLGGAGLLLGILVFGSTAIGGSPDSAVRVGALGAGGVMLFVGMVWESQLRVAAGAVDEREAQIYYRASWVSLLGLMATALTLQVGLTEDIVSLSQTGVMWMVTSAVYGTFFASQWVYRWVM